MEHQQSVQPKLLILGLSRTGTTSIRHALYELGYGKVYYYTSLADNGCRDVPTWVAALKGKFEGGRSFGKADWNRLLSDSMAVADAPCNVFPEELVESFPDARVILSVRDNADVWYRSYLDTIWSFYQQRFHPKGCLERLASWIIPSDEFSELSRLIDAHTPAGDFPAKGKQWYADHNQRVRELVSSEKLLEFNVKEGWGPLCQFLQKDVPSKPFPRLNDSESFRKHLQRMMQFQTDASIRRLTRRFSVAMLVVAAVFGLAYLREVI